MAENVTIGGSGTLFVGEDKTLRLELLQIPAGSPAGATLESHGVPVNMVGWTVQCDVRKTDDAGGSAILGVAASITGTYNATRASNTQRAVVTLTDTQMLTVAAEGYRHSWKRTDDGSETILAYGLFMPQRATQI